MNSNSERRVIQGPWLTPVESELAAIADDLGDILRRGKAPMPAKPPMPSVWSAEHVEIVNVNGFCEMRPASPWDRCPYCWSDRSQRNTEAVATTEGAAVCRCAALRRSCEAYTAAGVPVLMGTVGASLHGFRWGDVEQKRLVMGWARRNQGEIPGDPTDRARPLLMLCGTTGTGKSHLAAALIRRAAMVCPGSRPLWVTWKECKDLAALKSPGRDAGDLALARFGRLVALKERYERSGMMVIDEWKGDAGDFGRDTIEKICDMRGNQQRPTVLTSNMAPQVARISAGDRAWSRLTGMGEYIGLVGPDARTA